MPKTVRRQIPAPPPRWLRPRMHPSQVLTLQIFHIWLVHEIHSGQGTYATLLDLVEMAFTWSRTAELLGRGEPEMAPQLDLAARLLERYAQTHRVEFIGDEYAQACIGSIVMDLLAEFTDAETAKLATYWSEACLTAMRQGAQAGQAMKQAGVVAC
jgi:hypothetical protein